MLRRLLRRAKPLRVTTRAARRRTVVGPSPLYEERGWVRSKGELRGWYRTRFGAFAGRIEEPFSRSPVFFIEKPPPEVFTGPHGPCFMQRSRREFFVHFAPAPTTPDGGILLIEAHIREALQ